MDQVAILDPDNGTAHCLVTLVRSYTCAPQDMGRIISLGVEIASFVSGRFGNWIMIVHSFWEIWKRRNYFFF